MSRSWKRWALFSAWICSSALAADGAGLYRSQCAACHGAAAAGNAALQAPPLAGLDAAYLGRQLQAFRAAHRGGEGAPQPAQAMRAVAQSLKGEDEIRAVAGHLEQARAARPAAESAPPAQLNAGRALYGVCIACHGNAGEGNRSLQAPALAQFPSWYLAAQLSAYRAGTRGGTAEDRLGQQMRQVALEALDGQESIEAVSRYITTLRKRGP